MPRLEDQYTTPFRNKWFKYRVFTALAVMVGIVAVKVTPGPDNWWELGGAFLATGFVGALIVCAVIFGRRYTVSWRKGKLTFHRVDKHYWP